MRAAKPAGSHSYGVKHERVSRMSVPGFVNGSSGVLSGDRSEPCDGVLDWVGGVTVDRPIEDHGAVMPQR